MKVQGAASASHRFSREEGPAGSRLELAAQDLRTPGGTLMASERSLARSREQRTHCRHFSAWSLFAPFSLYAGWTSWLREPVA